MKKLRKFLATPGVSLCAIALGILLLGTSTVGGAQAAMTVFSNAAYGANMQLQQIEVKLQENGTDPENGKLLDALVSKGEPLKLGVQYPEVLSVVNPSAKADNTTNITEYVRVTIRRYWTDNEMNPLPDLNSKYIELRYDGHLLGTDEMVKFNGWEEDTEARTEERIVLYYTKPVPVNDNVLIDFCQSLTLNEEAGRVVRQNTANGVTTTTYLYDGAKANLEVTVDAIQNSNAQDAARSAWGRLVNIDETTRELSLVYAEN